MLPKEAPLSSITELKGTCVPMGIKSEPETLVSTPVLLGKMLPLSGETKVLENKSRIQEEVTPIPIPPYPSLSSSLK